MEYSYGVNAVPKVDSSEGAGAMSAAEVAVWSVWL